MGGHSYSRMHLTMTCRKRRIVLCGVMLCIIPALAVAEDIAPIGFYVGVGELRGLRHVSDGATMLEHVAVEFRFVEHLAGGVTVGNSVSHQEVVDGDRDTTGRFGTIGLVYYPQKLSDEKPELIAFTADVGIYDVLSREYGYSLGTAFQFPVSKFAPMIRADLRYHFVGGEKADDFCSMSVGLKWGV